MVSSTKAKLEHYIDDEGKELGNELLGTRTPSKNGAVLAAASALGHPGEAASKTVIPKAKIQRKGININI